MAIASGNHFIVSGGNDQVLRIWSLKNREHLAALQAHTGYIRYAAITSDNKYLISRLGDGEIKILNYFSMNKSSKYPIN